MIKPCISDLMVCGDGVHVAVEFMWRDNENNDSDDNGC